MDYIAVIAMVYHRWGAMDQERVARNVKHWCEVNMDKDSYRLNFMDNGRQVVVNALFDREEYLTAFKQRFAPAEEG